MPRSWGMWRLTVIISRPSDLLIYLISFIYSLSHPFFLVLSFSLCYSSILCMPSLHWNISFTFLLLHFILYRILVISFSCFPSFFPQQHTTWSSFSPLGSCEYFHSAKTWYRISLYSRFADDIGVSQRQPKTRLKTTKFPGFLSDLRKLLITYSALSANNNSKTADSNIFFFYFACCDLCDTEKYTDLSDFILTLTSLT